MTSAAPPSMTVEQAFEAGKKGRRQVLEATLDWEQPDSRAWACWRGMWVGQRWGSLNLYLTTHRAPSTEMPWWPKDTRHREVWAALVAAGTNAPMTRAAYLQHPTARKAWLDRAKSAYRPVHPMAQAIALRDLPHLKVLLGEPLTFEGWMPGLDRKKDRWVPRESLDHNPLADAVEAGWINGVEALLAAGAVSNWPLITIAAQRQQDEMIRWLLAHGHDVNALNPKHHSALGRMARSVPDLLYHRGSHGPQHLTDDERQVRVDTAAILTAAGADWERSDGKTHRADPVWLLWDKHVGPGMGSRLRAQALSDQVTQAMGEGPTRHVARPRL